MLTSNDIAPAYAGIISGISNTFATIPGIISPYVVGALTEKVCIFISKYRYVFCINQDPNNWRIVFFICASIYITGAIVFLFIGSSELQPWAVKHNENPVLYDDLLLSEF